MSYVFLFSSKNTLLIVLISNLCTFSFLFPQGQDPYHVLENLAMYIKDEYANKKGEQVRISLPRALIVLSCFFLSTMLPFYFLCTFFM
jgi:hypothetical protein